MQGNGEEQLVVAWRNNLTYKAKEKVKVMPVFESFLSLLPVVLNKYLQTLMRLGPSERVCLKEKTAVQK